MGNSDTKLNFRKAVVQLTTKTQPVEANDEAFWNQFWSESVTCVQDVFTLIPAQEIRALREENPSNLATLCYKAVEKLVSASETGCRVLREQQAVLSCIRLLTRILPYIFEDPDWRGFFWSTLPRQAEEQNPENDSPPLAQSLIGALCDLLFCPEFTVSSNRKSGPDQPEDVSNIDSCEYIWESGVGFAHSPAANLQYDQHRTEILKLLLTCFSETMYTPPLADSQAQPNQWIAYITSTENRHALPLFTSLLNVVCAYDPVGYGVPYNHLMFADSREPLVEIALQVLCVSLDNDLMTNLSVDGTAGGTAMEGGQDMAASDNLFINYMSRVHREEDFAFILKGLTRLLNNPLIQTYLPGSCKRIQFHQELLVLFWKMCDINKKFMFYVLKSSDVLDILVPILYYLNDARADQSRVGLMHIGVFILLLLSGERNFGVRLNKPYTVRVPMDIPVFTGTHADFLIIVFHKIITTGHQRLQPLFDCLLTIVVNVSPYLKTLSMVSSTKLLHLLEAFSTPWFLYASPTNHHLVFFILEVFNNVIQYQFDGNSNLVYTIIRKRNVFHQLANLPTDHASIAKALTKRSKSKISQPQVDSSNEQPMEGSVPAQEAEPGTLKATLAATPAILPSVQLVRMRSPKHSSSAHSPQNQSPSFDSQQCQGHIKLIGVPTMVEFREKEDSYLQDFSQSTIDTSGVYLYTYPRKDTSSGGHGWNDLNALQNPGSMSPSSLKEHACMASRLHKGTPSSEQDGTESSCDTNSDSHQDSKTSITCEKPKLSILEQAQVQTVSNTETKARLASILGIDHMTEKSPASVAHIEQNLQHSFSSSTGEAQSVQPGQSITPELSPRHERRSVTEGDGMSEGEKESAAASDQTENKAESLSPPESASEASVSTHQEVATLRRGASVSSGWVATPDWVQSWKQKLPLQTIMRLLQVLVPQVEKICIDKGLTDESEILKFLQHGTLVGLLPVPHPILIRKYQANSGTTMWFRTYMWGVIYLRNVDPPIWYDTDVKLFEIQRV